MTANWLFATRTQRLATTFSSAMVVPPFFCLHLAIEMGGGLHQRVLAV
jgi:hypothetical protein